MLIAVLAACGQKGPLFKPTTPEARDRATLPQTIRPVMPDAAPSPAPAASGAAR